MNPVNLHDRDRANVETAEFADATIVIVVDIERGGAFASLYGTLELLPDHLRERVEGIGFLPIETDFSTEKHVERVTKELTGVGPLAGASGPVIGYEIRMGRSKPTRDQSP